MATVYKPKAIDDEDLEYWIDELVMYAERRANIGNVDSDSDDTVIVCRLCDDVDGHLEGCPIYTLNKVIKLTTRERKQRAEAKNETSDPSKGR